MITVIPREKNCFVSRPIPRFSWWLEGTEGIMQKTWRIVVAHDRSLLPDHPDVCDTGPIKSDISTGITLSNSALKSRERIWFQIRIETTDGKLSDWSEPAWMEAALLNNGDWSADWISFDGNNPTHSAPCPYFRQEFQVENEIESARLYVSARGLAEPHLNGSKIGNDKLVPGWTDFRKEIQYLVYDVTTQVSRGTNALGAILGEGWYAGYLPTRYHGFYNGTPELLMQLEISFTDGSRRIIGTDKNWRCTTGPVLYSDLYEGERYDARFEMPGWDQANFNDSAWRSAKSSEPASESPEIVLKLCPPTRPMQEIAPVRLLRPRNDLYIFDFGQNISGYIRFRLRNANPGNKFFRFQFGEALYEDNTLYTLNYRTALVTDILRFRIEKKGEDFIWEPHFTYRGFRYLQLDGHQFCGEEIENIEITAVAVYADLPATGTLKCGHELVNRLLANILWSQRDNFVELPTDCPQRDERLGWTGDAQIFVRTAAFNMDVELFFEKWLRDLRTAQRASGAVTNFAPDLNDDQPTAWVDAMSETGAAAWADAMVICPWCIYVHYGSERVLAENYEAMKRWVDYQAHTADDFIRPPTVWGDWLALSSQPTPSELIGTAYFARTADILGTTAQILGKEDDAAYYHQLAQQVRSAFRKRFLDSNGLLVPSTQTACALALAFDLLEPSERKVNADLLDHLVAANGDRLDTGFVGTALLAPALSRNGKHSRACSLLLQEEYPSWLFPVTQGATTIWERWNSYTRKDGFGNVNMNSFNHYAYGAVGEWVVTDLLGINLMPNAPGGKLIRFAAKPDRRLKFMRGELNTPYGRVSSSWEYSSDKLVWTIHSPPNTDIELHLPDGKFQINSKAVSECIVNLPNGTYVIKEQ